MGSAREDQVVITCEIRFLAGANQSQPEGGLAMAAGQRIIVALYLDECVAVAVHLLQ
jgi:hypothetical protein